jgi:hypothetical protein
VLLDHTADDSTIEIVVVFYTADNEIAVLKSDLIKAVHTAFDEMLEKRPQAEQRRRGSRGDGSVSAPRPVLAGVSSPRVGGSFWLLH